MKPSTKPRCRRCQDWVTDPSLIRGKPTVGTHASITITLCRPCHDECTKLVTDNAPIPHHVLQTHYRVNPMSCDYDDFLVELQLVFWRCAVDFEPRFGWKFTTYAFNSLRQATKSILTKHHKHGFSRVPHRVASPTSIQAGGDNDYVDMLTQDNDDPAANYEAIEVQELIEEALKHIPKREAFVLRVRHLQAEPWTLAMVGAELSVTRERVRQIEANAKQRLKKALEAMGVTA